MKLSTLDPGGLCCATCDHFMPYDAVREIPFNFIEAYCREKLPPEMLLRCRSKDRIPKGFMWACSEWRPSKSLEMVSDETLPPL